MWLYRRQTTRVAGGQKACTVRVGGLRQIQDGRGSGRFGSCQIFWRFRRFVSGGSGGSGGPGGSCQAVQAVS